MNNSEPSLSSPYPPCKRLNHCRHAAAAEDDDCDRQHQPLLPGLPDDVAHLCLSLVPPSSLYSVCRSWRRLIYSPSFPPFLSLHAILLPNETGSTHSQFSSPVQFSSYDPISCKWVPIPNPPPGTPLRLLLRHPSFISRRIPVQSVAVAGKLVLLAATADQFLPALPHPFVFDPMSGDWAHGPPIAAPRRWCAAGACGGAVYVASGVGSHYDNDVARTAERLDLSGHRRWERVAGLRDSRFSREAVDAVGWRGRLCMVNVKGAAAREGLVYDAGRDAWGDMPEGMLAGWRGPAAAMAEETMYAVDEAAGWLMRYDHAEDAWVGVVRDEVMKGAQQLAAAGGKVCVLCANGEGIAVVDVAAARVQVVEIPAGFQAVGIHVLPRLCHSDD